FLLRRRSSRLRSYQSLQWIDKLSASWPGLSRPSTSLKCLRGFEDVDARDISAFTRVFRRAMRGHDESNVGPEPKGKAPQNPTPCSKHAVANAEEADQKNARVLISMLSRGLALGGEVGSSNAVWAVQRARPSLSESYTLNTRASSRRMRGK